MLRRLKKLIRWENSSKPDIDLGPELYEQLKPFRLPLVLIQLFILIGTLGYLALENYSLIQAFFQTAYTFTNTGFGSLNESNFNTLAIIFSSVLMFCGAGLITFSVALVVSIINNGTLTSLIKEKKMVNKIAMLRNHYVIYYHNKYTIELGKQFRDAQIPFVVVDNHHDFEKEAIKNKYPYYIIGDPHSNIPMLKAHLSSAKGIVTFSETISDNIALIVSVRLFEKDLGRKPYYIISSADTAEDVEKLKKLGSDNVVSPTKLMAQRISAMAIRPDMENILERFVYKKDTPLDMEEVIVPKYSWLVLHKLKEAHFREITRVSIIGITQKDGKYIPMPDGDAIITSEAKLLMIGTLGGIRETKYLITRRQKPKELDYV